MDLSATTNLIQDAKLLMLDQAAFDHIATYIPILDQWLVHSHLNIYFNLILADSYSDHSDIELKDLPIGWKFFR